MKILRDLIDRMRSESGTEYSLQRLADTVPPRQAQADMHYVRVWLHSARITEVRRWTTKFHASVHARFELADRTQGRREVLSVIAPDKSFQELDPRHLDRLITVDQVLLGPVPYRGELSMDIGLFSIAAADLAKPYLNMLVDLTKSAGVGFLAQASALAEPIRRGAEVLFSEGGRSQLEIGLSRTDTALQAGQWLVARAPKGRLPAGLRLDRDDKGLIDAQGRPLGGVPYLVIGIEVLDRRDDYAAIPDIGSAWETVRLAAGEGRADDEVRQRFAQLRRVVGLSPDLVPADRKRIVALFARELADAGYDIGMAPAPRLESAMMQPHLALRVAGDVLTPLALAADSAPSLESTVGGPSGGSSDRISMRELQLMVRDLDIPDSELRRYFTVDTALSRPYAPAVVIDPRRVDVLPPDGLEGAMAMNWANGLARQRRKRRFEARIAAGDTRPVLVSEGDSWFQFPIFLEDVIDHLGRSFNVFSTDAAGDTLQNMVHGDAEYLRSLRHLGGQARALLFSGGGNDIVGEDEDGTPWIDRIIKPFQAGRPLDDYIDTDGFSARLRFIEDCYRKLLTSVEDEFPGLPVVCHGYDYSLPGGFPGDTRNPLWARQDQWIGRPLRGLGIVDAALQQAIVRRMIDRLNQRLAALCGGNNPAGSFARAWLVDARTVVNGRWADELHPSDAGYADVAVRFESVLRQALGLPWLEGSPASETPSPNSGDDSAVAAEDGGAAGLESATRAWRVAGGLKRLRQEIDLLAPGRSKASDGSIGDARHAVSTSDHNPWVEADGMGVVTAIDITHDPARGCDCALLAERLREARDPRIKYVIWNRRIFSSVRQPWVWRSYTGSNPHAHHVHVSVQSQPELFDDAAPWGFA